VSKCLFSFFSKDLQLSEIKNFGGRKKNKKNTASKTYGYCDRNPKTYGSFVFLDMGPPILFLVFPFCWVLWRIYMVSRVSSKTLKSEEQKQTLNPKPGCFG
jgi:hypothetical protein